MQIAVVTGNPKPGSRTLGVAQAVADVLAAELDASSPPPVTASPPPPAALTRLVIDLAEHAASLFDPAAAETGAEIETPRSAEVVLRSLTAFDRRLKTPLAARKARPLLPQRTIVSTLL